MIFFNTKVTAIIKAVIGIPGFKKELSGQIIYCY
jgi:hypothetical protein